MSSESARPLARRPGATSASVARLVWGMARQRGGTISAERLAGNQVRAMSQKPSTPGISRPGFLPARRQMSAAPRLMAAM